MFGNNSSFERKKYLKGDILFKEGDKISALYVLASGKILNFSHKNGRIIPLYLSEGSGVVAEDCVLTQERVCHYNSICLEDSIIIVIPRREVVQYVNESSEWIKDLIFNISKKSINTKKLITDHQIRSDQLNGGVEFSAEEEKFVLESLDSSI